jgi:hypothetical protein
MRQLTYEDLLLLPSADDRRPGVPLLLRFVVAVERGKVPDQKVLDELAKRLRSIINGTPADRALDLVRLRGRRPAKFLTGHELGKRTALAAEVKLRMVEFGETKDAAARALAKRGPSRSKYLRAFEHYQTDDAAKLIVKILTQARKTQGIFAFQPKTIGKPASQ